MNKPDDLDALAQLLPFYANGTLSLADRARVEAALTTSADLRGQLTEVRQMAMLVQQGGAAIMTGAEDTEDRLDRLRERLDDPETEDEAPETNQTPRPLSDLLGLLNPAKWHPAISLALALALLAQTAYIVMRSGEHDYQTASGDGEQVPANAAQIIVRLQPGAKWSDVEALLSDQSLTIVSGPSEGRLTMRLDNPDADVKVVREKLRQSPAIAFAELLK